jgi:hypothetical protein
MDKPLDKTAVSKYSARNPAAKDSRVPGKVLDAAIVPVKATRTYVFESFDQEDWDEVRTRLPEEYRWLSNKQLMHQACNRRKKGVYSTEEKKKMTALWADVKKAVRAYWSGDTSLEELGDHLEQLWSKSGRRTSRR